MISILIPAHTEGCVLGRLLAGIVNDPYIQIIVVANGCSDNTADVARRFGERVAVIETQIGSKANALNLGDQVATAFPRVYIDADVRFDAASIRALVEPLQDGKYLAASPRVEHDLTEASWFVRAFYEIDRRLPSSKETIGGSGVYALSKEGRRRFQAFPMIIADDAFVRRHFKPEERIVVKEAVSIVTPPTTLRGLVKIKTRSHYGNYEIAAKCHI
jgi:glycosyltransferase involved in cell wall biosynthesis